MEKSYEFQDEDGVNYQVTFRLLEKSGTERCYGIRAEIFGDKKNPEVAEATERFFTKEEAEKTIEMLCEFGVTPCTLCDII